MQRTRLSAAERKAVVLASARKVFADSGYEAARTQDIARQAGISEPIMYRHFPSKAALYRAVLREIIREQNANYELLGLAELSGRGIVRNMQAYFRTVIDPADSPLKERFRLLLASLTGDGNFATLVYRRANRLMERQIAQAMANARAAGDIVGRPLPVRNTSMFTEHVGTMLNVLAAKASRAPYEGSTDDLVRDAVWFCCRAVGFTDEAIERHLAD